MADTVDTADDVQVTVRDNAQQNRFEVLVGGEVAGFAAYRHEGDMIAFTHVEVDDGQKGDGLGFQLVRSALAEGRERGTPVLPYCPFVQGFLRKHPDQQDVVPASERPRFDLT